METVEYQKMDVLESRHWWFVAKRRYLDIVMKKFAKPGASVLDVGCGTGAVMQFFTEKGYRVEGIDMSDVALAYCREKGLSVKYSLAGSIDYPDATFDVVTASDVLEHLDDDGAAVREIWRVLKPGGMFIATVPAHQALWSYHDVSLHHKRRYGYRQFHDLVASEFDVLAFSWIHMAILLPAVVVRYTTRLFGGNGDTSDVKESSRLVNSCMGAVYAIELSLFALIRVLPFGLSLLVVGKKKY